MENDKASRGHVGKIWRSMILFLLVLLTGAELASALMKWRQDDGRFGQIASITKDSLCAITLTTGQVYYGMVVQAKNSYLQLGNVYYVENGTQGINGATQYRLVSRQKNDWHAPQWMVIPTARILYVENVGAQSRLAKLIAQDHSASPTR